MAGSMSHDPWLPAFVYVDMPVQLSVRVDLRRRRIVEIISPEFYRGIKEAKVELSSLLAAPEPLAKQAHQILDESFNWPACRFEDHFLYSEPDPFPNGRPQGMDAATVLSRVLGGADLSDIDLTRVMRHDLAQFLALMLGDPNRQGICKSTEQAEALGFGVLDGRGRFLDFQVLQHADGDLPDPEEVTGACDAFKGRHRVFTCAWWSMSRDEMAPELNAWIIKLQEDLIGTGMALHDHLMLVGDSPELGSYREQTENADRLWGRP